MQTPTLNLPLGLWFIVVYVLVKKMTIASFLFFVYSEIILNPNYPDKLPQI